MPDNFIRIAMMISMILVAEMIIVEEVINLLMILDQEETCLVGKLLIYE